MFKLLYLIKHNNFIFVEVCDESHGQESKSVIVLAKGSGHDPILGPDHLHGKDVGDEEDAGSGHADDHPSDHK